MNGVDKKWHEVLTFFATFPKKNIEPYKQRHSQSYRNRVPQDIEDTFHSWRYIKFEGNSPYAITQRGLQQLRDLEDIKRKDLTLIASVIAVLISILALVKSFGLF